MHACTFPCPPIQRSSWCQSITCRFALLFRIVRARGAWVSGGCTSPTLSAGWHGLAPLQATRTVDTPITVVNAGAVVTGQDLVSSCDEELFEPSRDLRELAFAQLQSMFQILSRLSPADAHTWRACVYARRADSLEAPQIRLQRIVCWPPRIQLPASQWSSAPAAGAAGFVSFSSSPAHSHGEMDDMLTLHRPAWEGGNGSTCETEASLVQEEMVLLPSSNLLVLPLAEAGVLVGLLVVDSADSPVLKAAPAGGGAASTTNSSVNGSRSSAVNEDALWCLRTAVPPLAKACAMDLRTALAGAQQAAQQRLARSLLTEARGPLKVLGTFGAMLAPRLRANSDSQPESDMAEGMAMQGQHLADVIAQLEAALRPVATAAMRIGAEQQLTLPAAAHSWAADVVQESVVSSAKQQLQLPGLPQQQQQQQLSAPVDPGRARLGASIRAGFLPEHCSSTSGAGVASSLALPSVAVQGTAVYAEQQQASLAGAPHLPGQWVNPASPLQCSSRNIRWSSIQPEAAPVTPAVAAEPGGSSGRSCSTVGTEYSGRPAGSGIDMQKTIDLEPIAEVVDTAQGIPTSSVCSQQSRTVVKTVTPDEIISTSSNKRKRQHAVQQQPASCNLVEASSHLLTAASRLGQVRGVRFIVHQPLQLDQPLVQPSSISSARSSAKRGSADAVVLLPRPIRPVLVGLAAAACRRVLGYVLDIALQCTPCGGQLCVTAHQGSDGVEVNVLHTGRAQPSRAHTTSKSLKAQGYSNGSSTTARNTSSTGKNSLLRQQAPEDSSIAASNGMQGLSFSSILDSSSSLVSLDFAGQLLRSFGGRLSVVYPCHFMNAVSGQLDVGSNIKLWLPPAAATN